LSGSIVVVDPTPLTLTPAKRASQKKYKVRVDGTVLSKTIGMPGTVRADPGVRSVQVTVNGYRTNKVSLEVVEGGNHVVRLTSTQRGVAPFLGAFGLLGALIALAWPGLCWRAAAAGSG
jgi:hypothetical protein